MLLLYHMQKNNSSITVCVRFHKYSDKCEKQYEINYWTCIGCNTCLLDTKPGRCLYFFALSVTAWWNHKTSDFANDDFVAQNSWCKAVNPSWRTAFSVTAFCNAACNLSSNPFLGVTTPSTSSYRIDAGHAASYATVACISVSTTLMFDAHLCVSTPIRFSRASALPPDIVFTASYLTWTSDIKNVCSFATCANTELRCR